jgi:chromosome partitioning protein
MIHSRVDYATSMTDGRTAGELDPESRSGAEITALWTYLHNLLTEDERHGEGQAHAAE